MTQRPRVLHFITHLGLGGSERVAFNLIQGLRDRFDFAVYAANGVNRGDIARSMRDELEKMDVPLYVGTRLSTKLGGTFVLTGLRGIKAVRSHQPDIIHLHHGVAEGSYAAMVSLQPSLGRISLVRTIHLARYWEDWRRVGRWCERRMPRSFVACVGKDAEDAFARHRREARAGPTPQPPVVIFNGVRVNGPARPLGQGFQERVRILFAAGRFETQKGADLVPQIIRQVEPRGGRRCELVLYGSGPEERALRRLASNPPAGWSVEMNQPVPNLMSRMSRFDLLLMPSRYEGLALVAIEASLLGLPVLATDGPGVRETFPPGYPWLARAGDAASFAQLLQNCLDNPTSWSRAARQAQDYARQYFDMTTMCDAYAKLYGAAFAAGPRTPVST